MASDENSDLAAQVAELRAETRVETRRTRDDIAEIKTDLRDFRKSAEERFNRMEAKFDQFKGEMSGEIKAQIASVKVWAFGLYVALAGTLLYVIAKSAKWL